jgi:methionyl-tRNA synthetase
MTSAGTAAGREGPARADKPYYVTVAIDYPNGEPHVGTAYEKVAADALVRYARLRGRSTFLLAGNDEHSQNVLRAARERDLDPEAYCAEMARIFRATWDGLGVGYDEFMRTADPRHVEAVRALVSRLHDGGHVYRGSYRGWYCVSCEAFKTDKEVRDGLCPVHGRPVERVEEENWFFRLSSFRDAILAHIEANPAFIQPETRRNEILQVLREGLSDISISRARTEWGVPLPWDPGQVVYVWFDALITYLSGAGFGWDGDRFARLWPADLHLIGKDITRFHCVVWPAMLMAAGLPLPRVVFGHGFLNLRGERISKTTGNVVAPAAFRERYGLDAMRWYLLAETPFGQDGNFAPETFVKRYNSDLANDLGNLLSRTVTMIERFAEGRIPEPPPGSDAGFAVAAREASARLAAAMDGLRLHEGPAAMLALCARANKYIDSESPWDLARDGRRAELAAVLYNAAETLRILALGLSPFLVEAPGRILEQLGLPREKAVDATWTDLQWGGLPPRTSVRKGPALFQRLDPEAVAGDRVAFGPGPGAPERQAAAGTVSIDALRSLDLRVATVTAAARMPGARRLLVLDVDLGAAGRRRIVSGIAEHYAAEDLVGRQVIVVANLEPAVIRGVRSEGMLLAASEGPDLRLVGPDGPIAAGTGVH